MPGTLQLYDNFEAGTVDAAKWNTSGTVTETGGNLLVWRRSGSTNKTSVADTNKPSANPFGTPIYGFKTSNYALTNRGPEGAGDYVRIGLYNGTDGIEVDIGMGVDFMALFASSGYGGPGLLSTPITNWAGTSGSIEIKENAGNMEVYYNDALKYTFTGYTTAANSYFRARATADAGSGDSYLTISDLSVYTNLRQSGFILALM